MIIKILTDFVCAGLFWWGGYSWHNARRFIMPVVLTGALYLLLNSLWALTALSSSVIFCLGYGDKSVLRRVFGNGWGRAIWGLLSGLAISLGLFLTGHVFWYFFLPYLILCFVLEDALKNLPQWIGDPIIGAGFGVIVFIVK